MARFDEQPAITTKMWSLFLRLVAWIVIAGIAEDLGNNTGSIVLSGLCGLGAGLALVILAWGDETAADEPDSPRNGKFDIYAKYLVATIIVGAWLFFSYQKASDGISTDSTFFWGYSVGLCGVCLAASRGYLKPRSIS